MEQRAEGRVGRPAPGLRGRVAYHGYDLAGLQAGHHRGLPSPYLTLIVTFDEPLTMRTAAGTLERRDVVIGGLHAEPVEIVHDGRQSGIHVALHPLAARLLLGAPSAALDTDVDAGEILGAAAREMHERVGEARDWEGRFAALDAVLSRRLGAAADEVSTAAPELGWAWRALVSPSPASVRSVADEVGWSDRHLGARFRAEFGLTPKVAARVARFDRARRVIAGRAIAGGSLGLADVAAAHGFADQAHLTREFRALAGASPTRWLAEEIGNVQDADRPDDAA